MGKLVFVILVVVCLYLFFKDDAPKPASHSPALSSETSTSESEPTKPYHSYARTGERGSGHQAGYDWAEQNGITDESACEEAGDHSNSPSFAEGCTEYVESLK